MRSSNAINTEYLKALDKLIYPLDFLPTSNPLQMKIIETFVKDLEASTGVKRTEISIARTWAAKPPTEAAKESIEDYLREVCS